MNSFVLFTANLTDSPGLESPLPEPGRTEAMSDPGPTNTDTDTTSARRVVVTGAGGFVGSHLVDTLLARGDTVVGIDCFTPYYDPDAKRQNLEQARDHEAFTLVEADLRDAELMPILEGADTIFHQAAQPGVRLSWSDGFGEYASHNVLATQRLLEAARDSDVRRVVYASSSSVYGNQERYPTVETDLPRPYSPYGVTKLAAEHLCGLYAENWDVHTVALRYFTVFGPRQRPDMSIHRLCGAALTGALVPALRRRQAGPRVHLRRRHRRGEPLRGRRGGGTRHRREHRRWW